MTVNRDSPMGKETQVQPIFDMPSELIVKFIKKEPMREQDLSPCIGSFFVAQLLVL